MNSISYITQRVEDALHPSDLDSIIPKENSMAPPATTINDTNNNTATKKSSQRSNKEDTSIPYIIRIILFVPNILIFRPLAFFWFVFTFPLSLLETHSKKAQPEHHDQQEQQQQEQQQEEGAEEGLEESKDNIHPKIPSIEQTLSSTILELDEDEEKVDRAEADDATDTDLKSPTSPSTTGILSHGSKLFTFPRTLYPMNLTSTDFKKTLILDLDETLVHSVSRGTRNATSAYQVEIKLQNQVATLYYVQKRPYCDFFLKQVSKWFNLVIFTASVKEYADPVIDLLETERKYFSQRYYRNHCTLREGQGYIKDISSIEKNLNHLMIIDNSPISYAMHEDNAIAVEGWISDTTDTDLLNLIPLLYSLRYTTDVRSVLSLKNGEAALER